MITGMSLFSGFGGADEGMAAAGIQMVAGIEYDPAIAEVARANGHAVDVLDIRQADPGRYMGIEALHASPVCTRASVANSSAAVNEDGLKEAALDIECAEATARFIECLRPKIFTLENVWGYRKFKSWRLIANTLDKLGYWWDIQHVNAADFGVPQTRRRMIVRAIHGAMIPSLPEPERWVGWHEAIEDLIPTLPESRFAPWQLERLPEELKVWLIGNDRNGDARDRLNLSAENDPAFTITSSNGTKLKAFLIGNGTRSEPVASIEPADTLTANHNQNGIRAFLVDGKLSTSGDAKTLQINGADHPAGTVVSSHSAARDARAWLSQGRIVKMTPRALARFQTFPDTYILPDKAALACKGIGNAAPALLMQKIYAGLLEAA